jgi:hypothetical protein
MDEDARSRSRAREREAHLSTSTLNVFSVGAMIVVRACESINARVSF